MRTILIATACAVIALPAWGQQPDQMAHTLQQTGRGIDIPPDVFSQTPLPWLANRIDADVHAALYSGLQQPDPCEKDAPPTPIDGQKSCAVAVGVGAIEVLTTGVNDTAIGRCSGASLEDGSRDLLIGDYTATPTPHTSDFANIDNKWCWWRTTGQRVACPPPEPECVKEDK
jgi:hypothetical protein